MNAALDRVSLAGLFPMDAATPFSCVHLGIEYPGEVVRARRWSSELGQAPKDDSHFKIVLLQERPRSGLPEMIALKTAICIPTASYGQQAHRIIGEITAAKQAAYLTRRDVDAVIINNALMDRQHDLEGQLNSAESARFSKGDICVLNHAGPNPESIFDGSDPVQWMDKLAQWILHRAYPSIPLDMDGLPNPISEDDAGTLFASIFNQPGADPYLLDRLAPALGLSSTNPSHCSVFPLIRKKIETRPASFDEVHRYLAYDVGLTSQLASLYLLLFIRHERPEHQIQLNDDATLHLVDGGPLLGARLTSDLIPLIAWDGQLPAKAAFIGPASPPRFIDAKHHLSVLCPEIASCSQDEAAKALYRMTESIAQDIATSSQVLDSLEAYLDDAADETGKLRVALERLGQISGHDYTQMYLSVRDTYSSLPELTYDLATMRQLVLLNDDVGEIFQAQRYIANANVPPERFANLAVDRDTLLTALSPSRLTGLRGRGWSAIARDAEAFKIRYTQAYREHHQKFHDALPLFQSELLSTEKKLAAVELLNSICELGPPPEARFVDDLAALPRGPLPCSFQGLEIDLSNDPYCWECHVSLDQTVPLVGLARLAPQIDAALATKTQKLSRLLVEKALAGRTDKRWLEFLQIVQASELSSLANTLDADLVSFIKQVLD